MLAFGEANIDISLLALNLPDHVLTDIQCILSSTDTMNASSELKPAVVMDTGSLVSWQDRVYSSVRI